MFGGLFRRKMKSNQAVNPIQSNTDINAQLQANLNRMTQHANTQRGNVSNIDPDDFNRRMLNQNSVMLKNFNRE